MYQIKSSINAEKIKWYPQNQQPWIKSTTDMWSFQSVLNCFPPIWKDLCLVWFLSFSKVKQFRKSWQNLAAQIEVMLRKAKRDRLTYSRGSIVALHVFILFYVVLPVIAINDVNLFVTWLLSLSSPTCCQKHHWLDLTLLMRFCIVDITVAVWIHDDHDDESPTESKMKMAQTPYKFITMILHRSCLPWYWFLSPRICIHGAWIFGMPACPHTNFKMAPSSCSYSKNIMH